MSDSGMDSSGVVREYPPRLHQKGKSPLQNHSINHYSAMTNLSIVKSELGDDVWSYLKNSSIGVFAKFADLNYTWASKRVEYFLANQLLVDDAHEIWSLIDDQPLRFSLNEFAAITGLNCDPIQPSDICALRHEDFWREMGISTATGPTFEELVTCTSDNAVDIQRMYKMVENVTRNVEDMKYLMTNLAKRVEANERNADQQKEFCSMFSMMKKYFEDFERKAENAQEKEEVQSAKIRVDEATSESPSWMVEVNQTSNNDFPSTRVVKKGKENKCEKKVEKEKPHVVDKKEVTKKVVVKIEKTDGEKKKKVGVENLKTPSNSEESIWSNPKDKEAHKAMDKALDCLVNLTTNLDGVSQKPKRELKLPGSQKYPFVGNSTVKRIVIGITVSPASYDPLEVVDDFLHEKLMEFLKTDEKEPLKTKDINRLDSYYS